MNRGLKKLALLVCAFLLAVIVGCQSVGGLNMNDMLLKQLDVTHQEQSQLLEVELDFNEALLEAEDQELTKLVQMFQKVSLKIDHAKTDELGNAWAHGTFSFAKGDIPFTVHTDAKAIRIDIDGAKRPLVLDLKEFTGEFGLRLNLDNQQAFTQTVRDLLKSVAPYFVKGLPNPPVITVNRVNESVHGVATGLNKVHAELNGEQLGKLIPIYLDNLIADKEGLKAMLGSFLEWFEGLPAEVKQLIGLEELGDSDMLLGEISDMLHNTLVDARKELADAQKEPEWKQIFDAGIAVKVDLYVDDVLDVRKYALEANIAPSVFAEEDSPIRSIKVRVSGESWNVNGAVEVPAVKVPVNALGADDLDEMEGYQFVRLFEEDSVIYQLLKNDLQIDDQEFFISNQSWSGNFYLDNGGVQYVPLRATLRDFGIKLNVPEAPGEIRFYDRATEQQIVLRAGSDRATVNGKEIKLSQPLERSYGHTYMAADDLFKLLGAEYKVTVLFDDWKHMTVTRDL
ncbi:stalk domain-containing protein [Cohnella boryungensis]|uniref:Stalk domain-containing protein n=1 Tax=Cohnella boryungensis TaxID=768479 RepID=A0ABV8SA69_9BACL